MDDECVEELGRPISSLKVAELRDELTKRALTKTGNKKELIDRLRMAIQRQATQQHQQQMCGTTAELTINQQVNPQQHQNVPQYMNAAVAMQQNQVAAAYQHQINQINQPQAAQIAAYTLNQQQYQKTVMQPLDLQQQLAAYPTQVQFVAADYQQQPQLQQQQQPLQLIIEPQQQYQASSVANQPAIDMRVVQQAPQSTSPEQSIDLSSNTKQLARQEPPDELEPTAFNDLTTVQDQQHDGINEPELANQNLTSQQDVKSQDSIMSEQKNSSAMIEDKSEEQIRTTGATAQPSINTTENLSEELILPVKSQDRQGVDQCSIESCKTIDPSTSTSTAQEGENTSQTSISLKRGPSETRSSLNTGNKEKRRKWSSKPTVTATEVGQDVVDGSQLNILTGGISSQKLKELITEKPTEVVKKTSKTDTAEFSEDHGKQETEADKIAEKSVKIKESDQEQTPQKDTSVIKANESQTGKEPDLPEQEQGSDPTRVLLIKNLVRPFTLLQLKEVLTKHGSMIEEKFWIDKVKSKCCVMYESLEVAQHTKESLDGQQWPSSNPKTLKIIYITEEILEKFQLSDSKVPDKAEVPENGNVEVANKLISDRLGERLEDGETAVGADLKKRLGDKVSGDVSTKQSSVNREGGSSTPQKLDDLFKKTEAVPHLFWLPLTDDLADIRQKEKKEREALREANKKARRSPPRRRAHSRHRSPPARRSPPRHRSPVSRRPPINRRTPIKHRSPIGRRSPPRRRSPFHNRSPMLRRSRSPMLRRSRSRSPMLRRSRSRSPMLRRSRSRSPMLRRSRTRSPMLRRSRSRSPVLRRRSPTMLRRSPARRSPIRRSPLGRSPGLIRRSPMLRRSPGPIRRSPVQIGPRRSPLLVRRSPGPVRRSPPLIRRSPAPIRGSSPTLKRRSPRRNSPPRHMSPNRNMGNYGPPDHRRIR